MHLRLRPALRLLLVLPVAIFAYVTVSLAIVHRVRGVPFSYEHNGTDLTFASSDGRWRGEEDMLSGRDFKAVLEEFELYRLRAARPDVRLLRTKPWKRPWKWAWWFDRRNSPKWKVPYAPPETLPTAGTVAPPSIDRTEAEFAQAQRAAEAYLETLR